MRSTSTRCDLARAATAARACFRVLPAFALAALLMPSSPALGDVLHLEDGRRVEGEVLRDDKDGVQIKTLTGRLKTYKRSEVAFVYRGDAKEPEIHDGVGPDGAGGDGAEVGPDGKIIKDVVDAQTARVESALGFDIRVALHKNMVVRGDLSLRDLGRIAEAGQLTLENFAKTFGAKLSDIVPKRGRKDPYRRIEVYQFKLEAGYVRYVDKVLKRMRDETVSDQLLALMRRQKGFWILSPHAVMAQYQGAGHLATSISNVSHKLSHTLLLLWEPAGTWRPWWFLEGFAAWQEIRITGDNRTYCLELARPGEYAKKGTPDADEAAKAKTEEIWRAKVKAMVRGNAERQLTLLGKRSLNEIVFEDVIQSWSVVDWLETEGVLKPFTLAYKEHRTLDKAFEEVLEISIPAAHDQWRKWVLRTY